MPYKLRYVGQDRAVFKARAKARPFFSHRLHAFTGRDPEIGYEGIEPGPDEPVEGKPSPQRAKRAKRLRLLRI